MSTPIPYQQMREFFGQPDQETAAVVAALQEIRDELRNIHRDIQGLREGLSRAPAAPAEPSEGKEG